MKRNDTLCKKEAPAREKKKARFVDATEATFTHGAPLSKSATSATHTKPDKPCQPGKPDRPNTPKPAKKAKLAQAEVAEPALPDLVKPAPESPGPMPEADESETQVYNSGTMPCTPEPDEDVDGKRGAAGGKRPESLPLVTRLPSFASVQWLAQSQETKSEVDHPVFDHVSDSLAGMTIDLHCYEQMPERSEVWPDEWIDFGDYDVLAELERLISTQDPLTIATSDCLCIDRLLLNTL